jgi:hypothetical protein
VVVLEAGEVAGVKGGSWRGEEVGPVRAGG